MDVQRGQGIEKSWSREDLERSRRETLPECAAGPARQGGPGLLWRRPLAQTGASAFGAALLWLGVARRSWPGTHYGAGRAAPHTCAPSRRREGGASCVPPYREDCGIVADGAGRRRP